MARRVAAARPDSGESARFEARLRAKRPVLTELLGALYPAHDVDALVDRVVEHARQGWAKRKPSLVDLDVRREADPRWYQRSDRVGYVAYADRFGGFVVSAAIDRYIYVIANRRFFRSIRLSYSKTEIVDEVGAIEHPIFREALRMARIEHSIELTSVADLLVRALERAQRGQR